MYYLDFQRTLTRRESSLISTYRKNIVDDNVESQILSTSRGQCVAPPPCNSLTSFNGRPKGSVRKDLVTLFFEAMLECIVDSWEVITMHKPEENTPSVEFSKISSETTFMSKKRKNNG